MKNLQILMRSVHTNYKIKFNKILSRETSINHKMMSCCLLHVCLEYLCIYARLIYWNIYAILIIMQINSLVINYGIECVISHYILLTDATLCSILYFIVENLYLTCICTFSCLIHLPRISKLKKSIISDLSISMYLYGTGM